MRKEITEKRMVEKDVSIGFDIKCDCCGKQILHRVGERPASGIHNVWYYHFHGGHRDWGYDSIDSIESYDACSKECLLKIIDKFMEDNKDYGTKFFEVEEEHDR